MNCPSIHARFSALYEGTVSARTEQAMIAHFEHCEACQSAFDSFSSAVGALRSQRPPTTADPSASAIMRAIDLAAYEMAAPQAGPTADRNTLFKLAMRPPIQALRWPRIASHVAAAAIGAAAAMVLMVLAPRTPSPARSPDVASDTVAFQPAPPLGARLRFLSGPVQIARNGQIEHVVGATTLFPGDDIVIDAPKATIIERRMPLLPVDLQQVDFTEAHRTLDRSLELVRDSYSSLRSTLDLVANAHLSLPDSTYDARRVDLTIATPPVGEPDPTMPGVDAAMDQPGSASTAAAPSPTTTRSAHEPRDGMWAGGSAYAPPPTQALSQLPTPIGTPSRPTDVEFPPRRNDAPVLLRQDGRRLTLETRGSLSAVVPRLLALLHDGDPDVADLVIERLRLIRDQLAVDPRMAKRFAASDDKLRAAHQVPRTFFGTLFSADASAAPLSKEEIWNHWWEANANWLRDTEAADVY